MTSTSRDAARPGWRRPVVQFVVAGLLVAVVLALLTGWLSRRAAQDEAVTDAEATTVLLARSVVRPAIPDGLTAGRAAAMDRFDRTVRQRVLVGDVLRVKVWTPDGRIVYSDEPRLIGRQFTLGAEEAEMATLPPGSEVDAEISDLTRPENAYERPLGPLLEVYTPVRGPGGEPLLFEAYYSYDEVTRRGTEVLRAFRPITVGGILVFLALTVPLVWVLARRLAESSAQRERLLVAAADASAAERRRIARDLHDGVVQELAGTSFALSGTARDVATLPAPDSARDPLRGQLEALAASLRHALRSLRSLLVEIYPPDLSAQGLAGAIDDLVGPAVAAGIDVDVDVMDVAGVPDDVVALVWRTAQEAVRNAVRHAHPTHLSVRLVRDPSHRIMLEVADDGVGFDADHVPADHFGLRGLADLAREAGAEFSVRSRPGGGTTVRLQVTVR